jgi:hypothetical protein
MIHGKGENEGDRDKKPRPCSSIPGPRPFRDQETYGAYNQ